MAINQLLSNSIVFSQTSYFNYTINNGINELELQIEELNLKKETIEKKIENTLASMEPHTIIINKLYEEERKTNIFVTKISIEENYAKEHEDYQGLF